jgi:hypothetical protein
MKQVDSKFPWAGIENEGVFPPLLISSDAWMMRVFITRSKVNRITLMVHICMFCSI